MTWKREPIYCSLAYNGFALKQNGSPSPCCQWKLRDVKNIPILKWWETDRYINEVRSRIISDLENGIEHSGCSQCWNDEKNSIKSLRQKSNEWIVNTSNNEYNVIHLEVNLGILCNLRCIMCGPNASSLWETEYKTGSEKTKFWFNNFQKQSWVDDPKFLSWITPFLKNARYINFAGGEPLIVPQFESVIDIIISLGREKQVQLTMNTNLTKLPKKLLEKLSKFKNVNIMVSLEGFGKKNDYLRFPSKWEDIESNIDSLFNYPNFTVGIHHTIQHSSVYALPELIKFYYSKKFNSFYTNTVQGKLQLELEGVPKKDMDNFITWAKSIESIPEIKNLIPRLESVQFDPVVHQKFKQYINYIDSINGTDWNSTFCPSSID